MASRCKRPGAGLALAVLVLASGCAGPRPGAVATRSLPEAPAAAPRLELTLRPVSEAGRVAHVEVHMRIERPGIAAGGRLLRMGLVVASIPTARYDGDAIQARDAQGLLMLTAHDEPPTPSGSYRHWTTDRASVGDVEVRYLAPPREVSRATRNGPLFDLRAEQAGMHGAGLSFLALPDTTTRYRIRLRWDLGAMPEGSRGIWSLGEGDVETEGDAEMLAFTYYAAGPMQRFPADGGPFALYWFAEPPFDLPAVAADISAWFAQASRFFRDPGGSYRVFVRANPYPAGGGTALRRSFMFGWGVDRPVSAAELQGLLAHEITHNCPRLDGGATIVPPTSSFGPCLKPVPYHGPRFELGFDDFAAGKVRGLVADSNAARAGVQEGDEIVDRGDVEAARRDPARELVIKLRRGADLHEIHYLPRGAQVEGWRWTPAGPPLAQCRY